MNEHTEKNINEAIDWLQSTGATIQYFAAEQAPLYCREVVAWTLWHGVGGIVLGIPIAYCGFWLIKTAREMYRKKANGDEVFPAIGGMALIAGGVLLVSLSAKDVIKAIAAPRLVIVEHLRNLKP